MSQTATYEVLPDDEFDPEAGDTPVVQDVLDEDDFVEETEEELDEESATFLRDLIDRLMVFTEEFTGVTHFRYQKPLQRRIIESVIYNDGETLTCIAARQSGKSETVANTLAALMVILPKLAPIFPKYLDKFKSGFWVGVFGPVEDQGATIWGRIVSRLTSERATDFMLDPEIDDKIDKKSKGDKQPTIYLKNAGSLCRLQSANPRAKIESKSYHFIVIDEAQDADEFTIGKSISPMLAFYNGTLMLTGTAARTKGYFHKQIQYNKRRHLNSGRQKRPCHIEWDYRQPQKENPNYAKFIAKEKAKLGEDSEEFQMSYLNKWQLDRGMFVTEEALSDLYDPSMPVIKSWWQTPVVVGIDPARTKDSTVVTVVWIDWDHPDPFGYFEHRILNWLEINNEEWEHQYYEIVNFLSNYNVYRVAVDAQGVGGAVAERLQRLLPRSEVLALGSDGKAQNERWVHLQAIIQRKMLVIPGHSKARRLRTWRRFEQQMIDAEKVYKGPYLLVEAPDDSKDAHDDYPDSLALAAACTKDEIMPSVQVENNPFYDPRRR